MIASMLLLVAAPPLALAPPLVAPASKLMAERRRQRHRSQAITAGLPDVVDMARIVTAAGGTVGMTVQLLARRAPSPYAQSFASVVGSVAHGARLADSLPAVVDDIGDSIRPFVRALVSSERNGASLAPLLDRVRAEAVRDRRHHLDLAARRLPVLLLFPLVLCVLPAFVLLTVAPLLASALGDIQI
jgi:tight adherence protein C